MSHATSRVNLMQLRFECATLTSDDSGCVDAKEPEMRSRRGGPIGPCSGTLVEGGKVGGLLHSEDAKQADPEVTWQISGAVGGSRGISQEADETLMVGIYPCAERSMISRLTGGKAYCGNLVG
jgi:hypothetical protein